MVQGKPVHLAGAIEYTDCISADGQDPPSSKKQVSWILH